MMQNDHRQVFFRPGFSNAVHQAIIVICAAGGTNVANLRTKYAQVYVNIIIKNGCGGGENRTPVRKSSAVGTTCLVRSLSLVEIRMIDSPELNELP